MMTDPSMWLFLAIVNTLITINAIRLANDKKLEHRLGVLVLITGTALLWVSFYHYSR